MSKAQQAAEERYPDGVYPRPRYTRDSLRAGFEAGWEARLPENPDPAVIEAMADIIKEQTGYGYGVARAVYAVMRGAMQ